MSGRNNKYDRSLFQRLEEAGTPVHMLDTQYRMHPCISDFPRRIFYDGNLLDGPNVKHPEYGNPLRNVVISKLRSFQVRKVIIFYFSKYVLSCVLNVSCPVVCETVAFHHLRP